MKNLILSVLFLTCLILGSQSSFVLADYSNSWSYSNPDSFYSRYDRYDYRPSRPAEIISIDLDPQDSLNSSFRIAAREGRLEDVEKLLLQGADVNSQSEEGKGALMYAARNCFYKIADFLIKRGAKVNLADAAGRTSLIFASRESCTEVVELLLKNHEIDPAIKDHNGKTALDYAQEDSVLEVGGNSQKIIRLLHIAAKANKTRLEPRRKIS